MTSLWSVNILLFVVGVAILIRGSDWFIDGAAHVAHHFRVPDVIVGLTLVSIGTSLPELATNVCAAMMEQGDVALGNVVGSNITNVLLVLGVAVVGIGHVPTTRIMFRRDAMVMLATFAMFGALCYLPITNPVISRLEGGILLLAFVGYLVYLIRDGLAEGDESAVDTVTAEAEPSNLVRAGVMLVLGGAMVTGGAKLMVDNVVWAAAELDVPETIVSATVISLGTSLPELAITVAGIVKKRNDIAMGNIIGSNIFNLVFVMGATAVIRPVNVGVEAFTVLVPCMLVTGAVLVIFMRTFWSLVRWEGALFLMGYGGFITYNVLQMTNG